MATDKNKRSKDDVEKILSTAKERYRLVIENEGDTRRLETEDMEFRAGKQWPDEIKFQREIDRRPCLTINRIPQFVRQITNDQRQNRPAIRVSPVDDKADPEIAEIFQGMIRHIEEYSNADVAYDTAFESAVIKGRGYFRLITDYCDPNSFDQEILFKRILNSGSVKFDPFSKEPDGSDSNWAIIDVEMSKDDYNQEFGESDLGQMHDWEALGDKDHDWISKDACKIAEYYFKTFKEVEIALLSTGQTVPVDQIKELPEGVEIVKKRKSTLPAIKWMKINAVEILEETDWVGQWIPVVPVYGDDLDVNGKRVFEGIIRHAKDPQRMYNYWASAETEAIALAPRAPFVGAEGQFEDHEAEWKTANIKNHSYLQYKPVSIDGSPIPPPQRQVFEPAVQAITNARSISAEDLKATTGMYDATLGNRQGEQSGLAIQRLRSQSQTSNFHFVDNLRRSQRHAGRILVDLMPKIYDTARAVRTIGQDDQEEIVLINQIFQEGNKQKSYFLGAGQYDVVCDNGPSFQTKRQEAVASMLDFIKAYPASAQFVGDLLAKNMDWPGAKEIADRLRKMLPPGVAENEDGDQPLPPAAAQQMQQMQAMIQQLTQHLNSAQDTINKKKLEIESNERIANLRAETDMLRDYMKIDANHAQLTFKQEVSNLHKRLDLLNQNQPIASDLNPTGGTPPGQQQPIGGGPQGQSPSQPPNGGQNMGANP